MGYCIFNNIAIAAKHAVENRGLKRVRVADRVCFGTTHRRLYTEM